jgi:hypothetical protein
MKTIAVFGKKGMKRSGSDISQLLSLLQVTVFSSKLLLLVVVVVLLLLLLLLLFLFLLFLYKMIKCDAGDADGDHSPQDCLPSSSGDACNLNILCAVPSSPLGQS